MAGIDAGIEMEQILTGTNGHHDFLQGSVARALAQTVDRALHLPGTLNHRRQGVGYGKAQIVMAVYRENRLVSVGHPGHDLSDGVTELLRNGIAHGVGNVNGPSTGGDCRLDDSAQEVEFGAPRILAGKLNIIHVSTSTLDRPDRLLNHRLRLHLQLVFHVNGRGGNEGVNTPPFRWANGLGGAVDILVECPGKAAYGGFPDVLGDALYRLEIALAGDRKPRFNDIHSKLLQHFGDTELLGLVHRCTGTLLTVAQGGVENHEVVGCGHRSASSGLWLRVGPVYHRNQRKKPRQHTLSGLVD